MRSLLAAVVPAVVAGALAVPGPARAVELCSTAVVQVLESAPFGVPHKLMLGSLELAVLDSQGKTATATRIAPRHWMGPPPARAGFVDYRWALPCLAPGDYALEARYTFRGDRAVHRTRLEVPLGRGEIDLRVHLSFTARSRHDQQPALLLFTAIRLLPATGLTLRAQWSPQPLGEARYVIENHTDRPVYGVGLNGNFIGTVERLDTRLGAYAEYSRGRVTAPQEEARPVSPHSTGLAREPEIAGRPRPYARGHYRFAVEYQHVPLGATVSDAQKRGAPVRRVYERYRAMAEFDIH